MQTVTLALLPNAEAHEACQEERYGGSILFVKLIASLMALRHEVIVLGLDHAQIKGVPCPQSEIKGQVGRDMLVCSPQAGLARERQVCESLDSGTGAADRTGMRGGCSRRQRHRESRSCRRRGGVARWKEARTYEFLSFSPSFFICKGAILCA